jgi:hypothetical protein
MTTQEKTKVVDAGAFSAFGETLETVAVRVKEGAATVSHSAKQASGTVGRAFTVGIYNTAYWTSYGVVYTTVFLKELLPADNTLRRGLEEGAVAALEARGKAHASEQGDEEEVVAPP